MLVFIGDFVHQWTVCIGDENSAFGTKEDLAPTRSIIIVNIDLAKISVRLEMLNRRFSLIDNFIVCFPLKIGVMMLVLNIDSGGECFCA